MVTKIKRTINDIRNPKWINAEHTLLNCEVDFDELDEEYVEFTASPNDTEEHGRQIYADCVAGNYGEIEEFDVAAFEARQEVEATERAEAEAERQVSLDKWKALGLTEEDLENLGMKLKKWRTDERDI